MKKNDNKAKPRKNPLKKTALNKKAMIEALEKSLGIVSTACKITGITRTTFYHWIRTDPEFAENVKQVEELVLDFAESKLHKQINQDNVTATIFFLKTRGKKRGYVEGTEVHYTEKQTLSWIS